MKILLFLLVLFIGSVASSSLLFPNQFYSKNLEIRNIRLDFHKKFPNSNAMANKYIKWLWRYSGMKSFPYWQKLILDLTNDFSISNLSKDVKIVEKINIFYEAIAKGDRESILRTSFRNTAVIKYLMESGFVIGEYTLDELIDIFLGSQQSEFDHSKLATDHEITEFISEWPEVDGYLFSYDQIAEIHGLLFKERRPANLVVDMLKMRIRELKDFSKLPVIVDNKVRSILLPLFQQELWLGESPDIFKSLSKYPEAIRCLALVRDPNRVRKQVLIILFPHHVIQGSCDAIIDLDLQIKIGGWRQNVYGQHNYFIQWELDACFFELLKIDNNDVRDRMILDWLWETTHRNNPNFLSIFYAKRSEVVRCIVDEEEQSFIYRILENRRPLRALNNLSNDELVPSWEERYWREAFENYVIFDNEKADLLLYLLVPRLFPKRVSRIALSIFLDRIRYGSNKLYVNSIWEEHLLGNSQAELKKHTIESLQETFSIHIDPSILGDLSHFNFEDFAASAYEKIRKAKIQYVEIEKLISLLQEPRALVEKLIFSDEIALRIASVYSKTELQTVLIKALVLSSKDRKISPDKLKGIEGVSIYLNCLYHTVDPVSLFQNTIMLHRGADKNVLLSNLRMASALDSFGHDFLKDLEMLLPCNGPQSI